MKSRKDRQRNVAGGVKQRWWKTKKFKWTAGIVGAILIAVIAVYGYYINNFLNTIQEPKDPDQKLVEVEKWTGTDPVNIVLLGVDNRDATDKHPRSDSILIVSVDPTTKDAHVMSVMRDTWINIPGYDKEKINAAHALGGPDLTIKTLKEFLQVPIHYYVKTDFQGFIGIVDAIGGVDIDVEKPLHYADDGVYDIHLDEGLQHLDGEKALMYVRFRYDAMADFARTERQRKFLEAVAAKMSSPATLLKIPKILEAIGPYIETNMPTSDMIKLGMLAREVNRDSIATMQVPPMENLKQGTAGGGQSVLIPDVYATQQAVYEFLNLDPTTVKKDESKQPQEYYEEEPVVPTNPNVEPEKPEPAPTPVPPPNPNNGTGGTTKPPGTGTGGTTTPGTGTGGTTPSPGTGTGGTTTPGTGTGGTTTPGTGTGGTTTPGTGGGTTPGTGTGGTTTPGGGTTPDPGTGGTTTPGTGTGGGTTPDPGTGGTTTPGTGTTQGTPSTTVQQLP